LAVESEEDDEVEDVVLDELPFDELFESEDDDEEDDESEPLLVDSLAFSFDAPFAPERLSVL
jgi:hypothetical protein